MSATRSPDIFYKDLTCETCKRMYKTAAGSLEIVEEAVKMVCEYKRKVRILKKRIAEMQEESLHVNM